MLSSLPCHCSQIRGSGVGPRCPGVLALLYSWLAFIIPLFARPHLPSLALVPARTLTRSPTTTAPLPPDHQRQTHPMSNPATRPYSITRTHSDHPSHPLHLLAINLKAGQAHLGDVVIPDRLRLELLKALLRIGGGVWRIQCTLSGMWLMGEMLELMGILRGWQR